MPLHKSSRGPRLDPTMISAPLGDFRHTMHIGRGGDAFGDTSFLSTHGPSSPNSNSVPAALPSTNSETQLNDGAADDYSPQSYDLQHSESVSSLSLDLDLDLGPSILGDVLGVMDGLGLDSDWTTAGEGEVFNLSKSTAEVDLGGNGEESLVSAKNEMNAKGEISQDEDEFSQKGDGQLSEGSNLKLKAAGLRPKVRFSDKREEIIGRDEEGEGLEQDVDVNEAECVSPTEGEREPGSGSDSSTIIRGNEEGERTNHMADSPPSPASSLDSEYEGVTSLDRRREEDCHSETDSEEEGTGNERGYTFEDEFDDEIGL